MVGLHNTRQAPRAPAVPANKSRIVLVESEPIVRLGFAKLIDDEPDLTVAGTADSAATAIELLAHVRADCVVIEIALGDRPDDGLDAVKRLHELHPAVPVLVLSTNDESLYTERALRAGAQGYVMKREAMDRVMSAIRRVLAGEIYVSEKMASRMVSKLITGRATADSPLEALSDREFEVFRLISQGVGPTQIARRLGLSVKTIETHRGHVKEKLGLRNGAELTRYALEWAMQQK